jgi:hypothetical protein
VAICRTGESVIIRHCGWDVFNFAMRAGVPAFPPRVANGREALQANEAGRLDTEVQHMRRLLRAKRAPG